MLLDPPEARQGHQNGPGQVLAVAVPLEGPYVGVFLTLHVNLVNFKFWLVPVGNGLVRYLT